MPSFFLHLQVTPAHTEFMICEIVYTRVGFVLRRSLVLNSDKHVNCMTGGRWEPVHVQGSEVARQRFEMGQVTLFWGV